MPCNGGLQLLYIILPTTLLTFCVWRAELFVSVWGDFFARTQNYFETSDFFLFVLQFLWYTWCKNILFSPVSLPSPPSFFYFMCVCLYVFSLVLVCMQVLELHNSISVCFPLWIAGAFEVYSIFVVADLPKYQRAQKLLFISLKWRPLRFEGADVNNVHRHPMFFLFVFWQNLKYLIH